MKKKDFNRLHVDLQKKTFSWLAIGAKHQENVAIVHAFDVVLEPPSLTSRQYLRCLENYDEATIEEVKRIPTKPGKKPYIEELTSKGNRKVFAYSYAKTVNVITDAPSEKVLLENGFRRVHFNPKRGDRFFHLGDRVKVETAKEAYYITGAKPSMWIR